MRSAQKFVVRVEDGILKNSITHLNLSVFCSWNRPPSLQVPGLDCMSLGRFWEVVEEIRGWLKCQVPL